MKTKSIVVIIILALIISVGLVTYFGLIQFYKGHCSYPSNPHIVTDSDDNVHVVWDEGVVKNDIFYEKMDSEGNILIPKKSIYHYEGAYLGVTHLFIDSSNNLHLLCIISKWEHETETKIYYCHHLKMDTNGKILKESPVFNTSIEERVGLLNYCMIASALDNNDDIHVIWYIKNLRVHYLKFSSAGNIIETDRILEGFFEETNWTQARFPTIYFSFVVDSKGTIHGLSYEGYSYDVRPNITGYHKYYPDDNIITPVNKTISGRTIDVDLNDCVYVITSKNLTKISNNGTILIKGNLSNVSVIPNYPVVIDDNGDYFYIGRSGVLDSKNHIHLVREIYEDKYTSGYYNYIQTFSVEYYLIDENGKIIKERILAISKAKYHQR